VALLNFFEQFYTLIFVWLACLAALFTLPKVKRISYRWFLLYIIFMAVAETVGNYMAFTGVRNHWYFNIFYIIQFLAVPYFFFNQLYLAGFRKAMRIYFYLFPLFVAADILWFQRFSNLLTYSFVAGSTFIFVLAVGYFWQLYVSDETQSIWHYPVFWISLAYIFYYTVALPYIGMLNYLWSSDPVFTKKYYFVFNIVIILHNLFLTAGFICMRRQTTKR
jgi:hypothetical protein